MQTDGSSRAIADARRRPADIGMASRVLQADENDLHAFVIARDGVCIIVYRDKLIELLTDE